MRSLKKTQIHESYGAMVMEARESNRLNQVEIDGNDRCQFKVALAFVFVCMDGCPLVTAVLFPCLPVTSQGFKEATWDYRCRTHTTHAFVFCFILASRSIAGRGRVAYIL